ncbi:MAG: hypothetical protein M3O21_01090 [Chloroflexota bacterium]|nr:hypothetical protein [Chloroflexota bacterium]
MSETSRAVQPWIAIVRGVDLPPGAEQAVQTAFEEGARWWREQTGRTFEVAPVAVYHSSSSFEELRAKHGETNNIWFALQHEAHDCGVLDNCDPKRAHYMTGLGGEMGGGMVGSENFGCAHVLPGKAAITGGFAYVLLGLDPARYGHPAQPWFASERRQAIGALMHELGPRLRRRRLPPARSHRRRPQPYVRLVELPRRHPHPRPARPTRWLPLPEVGWARNAVAHPDSIRAHRFGAWIDYCAAFVDKPAAEATFGRAAGNGRHRWSLVRSRDHGSGVRVPVRVGTHDHCWRGDCVHFHIGFSQSIGSDV